MFRSITFEVIGDQRLICEGCEQRVEHALKALPGVGQVRAEEERPGRRQGRPDRSREMNQATQRRVDSLHLDVPTVATRLTAMQECAGRPGRLQDTGARADKPWPTGSRTAGSGVAA